MEWAKAMKSPKPPREKEKKKSNQWAREREIWKGGIEGGFDVLNWKLKWDASLCVFSKMLTCLHEISIDNSLIFYMKN